MPIGSNLTSLIRKRPYSDLWWRWRKECMILYVLFLILRNKITKGTVQRFCHFNSALVHLIIAHVNGRYFAMLERNKNEKNRKSNWMLFIYCMKHQFGCPFMWVCQDPKSVIRVVFIVACTDKHLWCYVHLCILYRCI